MKRTVEITDQTPIAMLTVGQLKEILSINAKPDVELKQAKDFMTEKNYVYGIAGIKKLFNVSHVTAQKYKDTIISDAVTQRGKKIIVDADLAMKLFNEKHNK